MLLLLLCRINDSKVEDAVKMIADQVYPCTDSAMELFENRAYMCGISLEKDGGDSAEESGDSTSQGNLSFLRAPNNIARIKPATGRPCVPAFSLSGTVPTFTCDCLRFVCTFTRRRKFDLCVSTSSRTMLAFENNVSCSSSACSTPAFCRR